MGRFSGLKDANASGGLYFQPGNYVVEIVRVIFKPNRKREDCFIIETKVIESDNPSRLPGCKPSQVINFKQDAAARNVKQFVGAALGLADPDSYVPEDGQEVGDFWDSSTEFICSPENPLAGYQFRLNCVNKVTQKGNDYTLHNWGEIVSMPQAAAS